MLFRSLSVGHSFFEMARRFKASKKRAKQLALARKIIERGSNTSNDDIPESASLRKLKQQSPDRGSDQYATQQWLIVHVARLNELIGDLICPNCTGSGLQIQIDPQNQGFCNSLLLECSLCERDK